MGSGVINAGQAAMQGNYGQAAFALLGAGLSVARGSACSMVSQTAALGQRGLQAFGIAQGAVGAAGKFAQGDWMGGLLDLAESGAYAYKFMQACFSVRTQLLTRRGWLRMDKLQEGDEVWSKPEDNPEAPGEWKRVEELFVRQGVILLVHVGGHTIETTAEHPFWTRRAGWLPAIELMAGDEFVGKDGEWTVVEEVERTDREETLYNCRVADYHTYFVGGSDWGFSVWCIMRVRSPFRTVRSTATRGTIQRARASQLNSRANTVRATSVGIRV